MRALPLAMAHFAFIPFFPSFPSFSFLSLCCCHWMFSGCNSRKGKRKCLHCMLQRSSHVAEVINVMVLHNNNRSYSGKNDVSWHCSSNSCTKGEGAIVGQSTITAIAICD